MTKPSKTSSTKRQVAYTVPPYQSFCDAVVEGVLQKTGGDPLKLSDYTILVPNHDVGFLIRKAFLEKMDGKSGALPRIDAPGDVEDNYLSLLISNDPLLSQALMDIPPPVTRLERQLILAKEIMKIPGMSSSVQKAIKLGGELGRFLDEAERHHVDLDRMNKLVPDAFRAQWEKTSDFLEILTKTWPKTLEKMGRIDPEEHKNALVHIQAAHWDMHPPTKPVLAVGFTDTTPATQALLQAVAHMPQGEIVFPGLDLDLDTESWHALTEVHPQYAFAKILSGLKMTPQDVALWDFDVQDSIHARAMNLEATNTGRQKLLREAMRPAGTAEGWSNLKARKSVDHTVSNDNTVIDKRALTGMDMIVCGTPQEEASVIALKMRETLEVNGRTAMLVTADRSLARRVSARLKYWGIDVKDSAGSALSETSAGIFLSATAKMASDEWAPISFLEALKHPLSALSMDPQAFKDIVTIYEDTVLHGARPAPGAEGAKEALTMAFNRAARHPNPKLTPEEMDLRKAQLETFVTDLYTAGKDFFDMVSSETPYPFADILTAHIRFAETLATTPEKKGAMRIWRGDDGRGAAKFLSRLREASKDMPSMTGKDYGDVLQGLMRDVKIQPRGKRHPFLKILTPEQAMLQKADTIIVGGVNEDSWPGELVQNPWLSTEMIKSLGIAAPQEKTGHAALQFLQMTSNPNVLLSRAVRSGDAPTVASPFLTRLMMVLKGAGLEGKMTSKTRLLDIHKAIHTPAIITPIEAPKPTPDTKHRPKQLPVTAVEALMRDPYTVYAKYVLNIKQKASIDSSPSVAEKGTFTHDALDAFVKKYPDQLPDNAYDILLEMGRDTFKTRLNNPTVRSFWWPRFERIAMWFVKFEAERREMSRTLATEVRGKLEIDLGDGSVFTLTAIADRIDQNAEDQLEIIDYKTGSIPLQKAVAFGFSPQLTLEACIAYTGGFKGLDASDVGSLQYWKLSGARPAADVTEVRGDLEEHVSRAREGIERLMRAFNDSKTPYLSNPRPEWEPRYKNYEHLARDKEWRMAQQQKKKIKKSPKQKKGGK